MSYTEMDRETCEVEYGLEQTDLETCPKSVWSPERRERLVSPIGDRLRVTRAREIRKRLTQAERKRKSVTKKAHSERETRASTRTNPVLSKGHPQDVAHPATVDPAESSSETELYSVASFSETVRFQPLRAGSVTKEREHVLNGKGSDSDSSRRRDSVEPTPTHEQTALGRRSPQFPQNLRWGTVHASVPHNILRTIVIVFGCKAKYELTKNGFQEEFWGGQKR